MFVLFFIFREKFKKSNDLVKWANEKRVDIIEEVIKNDSKSDKRSTKRLEKIESKLKEIRSKQGDVSGKINEVSKDDYQSLEDLFINSGY